MDFTEIYKQTASLVSFSPGAHFILTAVQDRIIIRRADTFEISHTWTFDSAQTPTQLVLAKGKQSDANKCNITHANWSDDSEFVLAASAKRGTVHVYKIRDKEWSTRIDSGVEGLVKAEWAPDGRTILCFSEWGLRVTLWSLVTGTSRYIQFPIHPDRGYAFRSDGHYFVLAERHRSKDTLGIYDATQSYKLVRHFPVPTSSLSSFAISPIGNHIAIWEGPLEYKLVIATLTGDILSTYTIDPDPGFGIRSVCWHPSGGFLAVNGWDDRIHILDSLTWSLVSLLELSGHIPSGALLWREPVKWIEATEGRGFLSYERLEGPQIVSVTKPDTLKGPPKCGTVQLEWNRSGSLLLARFENAPYAVYLYNFPSIQEPFVPRLRCVIMQNKPVLQAKWNPLRDGSLVLCCGGKSIHTWSNEWVGENGVEEEMAECIGVPAKKFDCRDVRWAPDGKGILLMDKETFCCAFEVESE